MYTLGLFDIELIKSVTAECECSDIHKEYLKPVAWSTAGFNSKIKEVLRHQNNNNNLFTAKQLRKDPSLKGDFEVFLTSKSFAKDIRELINGQYVASQVVSATYESWLKDQFYILLYTTHQTFYPPSDDVPPPMPKRPSETIK